MSTHGSVASLRSAHSQARALHASNPKPTATSIDRKRGSTPSSATPRGERAIRLSKRRKRLDTSSDDEQSPEVREYMNTQTLHIARMSRDVHTARVQYHRLRMRELEMKRSFVEDELEESQASLSRVERQIGQIRKRLYDSGCAASVDQSRQQWTGLFNSSPLATFAFDEPEAESSYQGSEPGSQTLQVPSGPEALAAMARVLRTFPADLASFHTTVQMACLITSWEPLAFGSRHSTGLGFQVLDVAEVAACAVLGLPALLVMLLVTGVISGGLPPILRRITARRPRQGEHSLMRDQTLGGFLDQAEFGDPPRQPLQVDAFFAPGMGPSIASSTVSTPGGAFLAPIEYTGPSIEVPESHYGRLVSADMPPRPTFSSRSLALSTRSTHSVLDGASEDRVRKSSLSIADKRNFERAFDLAIQGVIRTLGWGNSGRIDETTRECLSQACCESNHRSSFLYSGRGYRLAELLEFSETDWSDDLRRLFGEQRHTFRSKMMQTAAPFANKYGMSGRVGPQGVLPPAGKAAAAARLCEDMINDENWELYYLHNRAGTAGNGNILFANPIFLEYHLQFWYRHPMSPLRRLRLDSDTMWATTPIRLLASSATALACALRRAARGVEAGSSADASLRYSVEAYAPMEARVINGMNQVLEGSGTAAVSRHGLENMPFDLHRRGLELLSKTQTPRSPHFYIPSFEQLLSLTGAQPFTEAQGETQFLPRETQEVVGASVRGQALAFEATQGLAPYRDESKGALEGWVPAGFGDRSAAFHSFVELVRGLSPRELTPVLAPVSPRVKLWFALLMGSGGGEPSDAFERQRVLDKRRELWRYHCILVFQ
ncbi:hypothetical protein L210DRAFT_3509235 [Boletus edulis BED1]|uniref:DUF6532 domain-containing protein n=1 Tax=Boletus edulis BED1 TaxID=1328754 RepID=A0AAD4G830_BOLED|nr:hypothetical protein L210DRAFT_3513896 [Boletus edulis BED1]KAF8425839.1 hypothetical protein L210DRAFT_3509235 [Boletus edulis BED1]